MWHKKCHEILQWLKLYDKCVKDGRIVGWSEKGLKERISSQRDFSKNSGFASYLCQTRELDAVLISFVNFNDYYRKAW